MLRNSAVISISLPPELLVRLDQFKNQSKKTRSEIVKDLIVSYLQDKSWSQIFTWGRESKEKLNIKSEEDIIKLIND